MPAAATSTVRSVGSLLPPDILAAVTAADLPGLRPADYGLADGETIREAANRSWDRLRGAWQAFRRLVPPAVPGELVVGAHTETTRNRWLRVLFEELGYGRLLALSSRWSRPLCWMCRSRRWWVERGPEGVRLAAGLRGCQPTGPGVAVTRHRH